MTKTAQQEQEPGSVQSLRGCFRHTFPSPATWWVFNHHNRSLHEWSGDSLCADVPIRPNTKQVLVVRPRGGRSGKNWRIFVRPREVGVKIDFSPKAAGRRWNGDFHPRPDRKVASCRGFGLGNTRLQSVYTKPNLIHLQIHKLTGATLFARNPPYHLHECPTLLAHSLDAYQRTKYWMILDTLGVETQSPSKWYMNHSLNIFIIQDVYCDHFVLYSPLGVVFESFIGNIQYSGHEFHSVHGKCHCQWGAFTTRRILGSVTRYIQDIFDSL